MPLPSPNHPSPSSLPQNLRILYAISSAPLPNRDYKQVNLPLTDLRQKQAIPLLERHSLPVNPNRKSAFSSPPMPAPFN